MSDGTEQHRQDTVDGIEYSIYIWDEYVNKVALVQDLLRIVTFWSQKHFRSDLIVTLCHKEPQEAGGTLIREDDHVVMAGEE